MAKAYRSRVQWQDAVMAEERAYFARHQLRAVDEQAGRWVIMERIGERWDSNLWTEVQVVGGGTLIAHGDIDLVGWSNYRGAEGEGVRHVVAWIGGNARDPRLGKVQRTLGSRAAAPSMEPEVFLNDLRGLLEDGGGATFNRRILKAIKELEAEGTLPGKEHCQAIAHGLWRDGTLEGESAGSMGYVTPRAVLRAHAAVVRLHELLTASGPSDVPPVASPVDLACELAVARAELAQEEAIRTRLLKDLAVACGTPEDAGAILASVASTRSERDRLAGALAVFQEAARVALRAPQERSMPTLSVIAYGATGLEPPPTDVLLPGGRSMFDLYEGARRVRGARRGGEERAIDVVGDVMESALLRLRFFLGVPVGTPLRVEAGPWKAGPPASVTRHPQLGLAITREGAGPDAHQVVRRLDLEQPAQGGGEPR